MSAVWGSRRRVDMAHVAAIPALDVTHAVSLLTLLGWYGTATVRYSAGPPSDEYWFHHGSCACRKLELCQPCVPVTTNGTNLTTTLHLWGLSRSALITSRAFQCTRAEMQNQWGLVEHLTAFEGRRDRRCVASVLQVLLNLLVPAWRHSRPLDSV